jgi:hypothetical protein
MNKLYVIVPGTLLAVFLGFERDFQRKRSEAEKIRVASVEAVKAEEETNRLNRQRLAADEARQRIEQREQQERERAEKKRRDDEAVTASLKEDGDIQTAQAEKLAQDLATLAAQITALRAQKEVADREGFELARAVALQRVDRRNAEIEVQRTTAMVAARLNETAPSTP